MAHPDVQYGEAAHRVADEVGPVGPDGIEYGDRIVGRSVLAVRGGVLRHVGRWVAAGTVGDAAKTPREVPHLVRPRAVVAGELVHEDDRRTAAALFVVKAYAVVGGRVGHGSS